MVKNCDNMLSRFHLMPERYGQTDRQTDGRTHGRYQYCASVLTRDKNFSFYVNAIDILNKKLLSK